jgi:hypothetical protein
MQKILTVAKLAAWLETQDPDREYDYGDCENCMIAQYAKANGFPRALSGANTISDRATSNIYIMPRQMDKAAQGYDWSHIHTFGAALERCRALEAAR